MRCENMLAICMVAALEIAVFASSKPDSLRHFHFSRDFISEPTNHSRIVERNTQKWLKTTYWEISSSAS